MPDVSQPNDRPRRLVAQRRRLTWRFVLVAAGAIALGFGMEALVTGAIAFFAYQLGFWRGLSAFTITWLLAGVVVLIVTERLWPEGLREDREHLLAKGVIGRWILRLSRRARFPAALVVAWFFGPLQAPPAFLALGYHGSELALWEIASAPIFCSFWFAWTVGGFHVARDLLIHLL